MRKTFVSMISFLLITTVFNQRSVNAFGGNGSYYIRSSSYCIGQVAYVRVSNSDGLVSEGVKKVFHISMLNSEEHIFSFRLNVYPNLKEDSLILSEANYIQEKLTYRVLENEGELLTSSNIHRKETVIQMFHLPTVTYFVEVQHDDKKYNCLK
jgi:hypothetical protein